MHVCLSIFLFLCLSVSVSLLACRPVSVYFCPKPISPKASKPFLTTKSFSILTTPKLEPSSVYSKKKC
jgi:hypothetical protein